MNKKTIFFSYAHPDDETFTAGGIITRYSKRDDVTTIVYSATLGDAGKCGNPPVCKKEDLADVRKEELICATHILGVDHLITDTFHDGKLQDLPRGELKNRVKELLRKYKPDIVVTFPPHGLSGHRDHMAIQLATYEAVLEVKEEWDLKALYYVTIPSSIVKNSTHRVFTDPDDQIDVAIHLTAEEANNVRKALLQHKTQHLSIERVFPNIYDDHTDFHKYNNVEYFMRIYARDNQAFSNHDLLP